MILCRMRRGRRKWLDDNNTNHQYLEYNNSIDNNNNNHSNNNHQRQSYYIVFKKIFQLLLLLGYIRHIQHHHQRHHQQFQQQYMIPIIVVSSFTITTIPSNMIYHYHHIPSSHPPLHNNIDHTWMTRHSLFYHHQYQYRRRLRRKQQYDSSSFWLLKEKTCDQSISMNDDQLMNDNDDNDKNNNNRNDNENNNNNNNNDVMIITKVNGRYIRTNNNNKNKVCNEALPVIQTPQPKQEQESLTSTSLITTSSSSTSTVQSSQNNTNTNSNSNNNIPFNINVEYRYSVSDWFPIMCSIFQSSTLQYTRGPIIAIMIWSFVLCIIQSIWYYLSTTTTATSTSWIQQYIVLHCSNIITIPSTSKVHAFTVSVLSLLLVFRTTSAYQKFDEGRLIWERILSISRNLIRQIYLYPEFSNTTNQNQNNTKLRIVQLLASYPYFLYQHVKSPPIVSKSKSTKATPLRRTFRTKSTSSSITNTNHNESNIEQSKSIWKNIFRWRNSRQHQEQKTITSTNNNNINNNNNNGNNAIYNQQPKIISQELPWSLFIHDTNINNASFNRDVIQKLMKVENRPLYICDRIGQEIVQVPYTTTYTSMERTVLLQFINELTEAISECERIHRTMVPLNYARHSLRGLTVWLFTLPIILIQSYNWWTSPIMGLTAWIYYGIYQIGYVIEDPFQRTIRLTTICDSIYYDVIHNEHRSTAYNISLSGDESGDWKDLPL